MHLFIQQPLVITRAAAYHQQVPVTAKAAHKLIPSVKHPIDGLLLNNKSKSFDPERSPRDQETGIRYNYDPVKPVRRVLPTFFIYLSASSDTAGRDVRQPKLVGEGAGICLVSFRFCESGTCSAAGCTATSRPPPRRRRRRAPSPTFAQKTQN